MARCQQHNETINAYTGETAQTAIPDCVECAALEAWRHAAYHDPRQAIVFDNFVALGFDSVATVAACATVRLRARPYVPFRPRMFQIDPEVAVAFQVMRLALGRDETLLADTTGVPAAIFSAVRHPIVFTWRTARVGEEITLEITNLAGFAMRFRAVLLGEHV